MPELLLAPEVALGRLYRNVPKEELDLVQFPAGEVTQPGTRAAQVVWGQLGDARFGGRMPRDVPQDLRRHPVAPDVAQLGDGSEHGPFSDAGRRRPRVDRVLDPGRHGDGADVPALADEIGMTQCSSRC